MFAKLLKYEFRYVGKWYFALNCAILVIAAILGFILKSLIHQTQVNNVTSAVISFSLFLILGALIASAWIATLFIIIKRFYNNIFGREGYLTLTLPVSTHQIIWSKLLASIIWSIFNSMVIIVAILLVVIPSVGVKDVLVALPYIHEIFPNVNWILVAIYILLSSISGTLMIYLAIALGQLFTNHRILMGFVSYGVILILASIIDFIVTENKLVMDDLLFTPQYFYFAIIQFIIMTVIFYSGTYYIIKSKLNIQ